MPRGRRIVVWGTYDLGKPRVRILLQGLRELGEDVIECHASVWDSVEDKSQISGIARRARFAARWLISYLRLAWRYLRLPRHDLLLVLYMGHLDVIVVRPLAWLRGVPIVWDAFVSLYGTIVEDRALVKPGGLMARGVWLWEKLACLCADRVLLDTREHARYFIDTYGVPEAKTGRVLVGAETDVFDWTGSVEKRKADETCRVLFYGQFIPLHGIDVVVQAAHNTQDAKVFWHIIGRGQEEARIRALIEELDPANLHWTPWISYEKLIHEIMNADICLGIFGTTDKALRVIPNKVYQALSAGRPLITEDSPAAREILEEGPYLRLVPPGDPVALAKAVRSIASAPKVRGHAHPELLERISPAGVGRDLVGIIDATLERKQASGR